MARCSAQSRIFATVARWMKVPCQTRATAHRSSSIESQGRGRRKWSTTLLTIFSKLKRQALSLTRLRSSPDREMAQREEDRTAITLKNPHEKKRTHSALLSIMALFALIKTWWIGLLVLASPVLAQGPSTTPEEAMRLWIQTYPQDLPNAVALTTPRMRQFLTPSQWISTVDQQLKRMAVHHVQRDIMAERSSGDRSVFTVHARISTEQGVHQQWEYYTVRPFCSTWLIDHMHIVQDNLTPDP